MSAKPVAKGIWARARGNAARWAQAHNLAACAVIALAVCLAVIGLLAFVVFSDFGGTATFIYNQF